MLSAVARPALRSQTLVRARGFHASRVAKSADHDYHHLPFAWPENKISFGVKVSAYLITGFAIPFVAAAYQLKKAGGSD
ncbi:hypothetical protein D9619_000463 [Psilocybe cf. subviscida]|uniref:Cytochrome c oxidase subunit 8, mitochondrial n=1 Tax=Psilocybe cf. subviscida TaxID=2480587 RepID=A0A8H5BED4_9AGAR|nr:hypothetical protein D9619_000463 [Psilocybe cf. subviscida]